MIITGIKKNQITHRQIIFLSFAPKMPAASLDKADDIIFMKMIREFLNDAAEVIGFYI